ncbi:MAG: hypothetical protein J5542_10100 [Bacteroidales bacterium]|nr:hypothetical protein [Bacteroidales bacterium]
MQEKLDQLFGSYKAEWLKSDIFKFFTEPYYFSALKSNSPGVLQGGRGTGKTTVLRGLSYIGQYEILNSKICDFDKNKFIGIYYRANTNHVRAFTGKGVSKEKWIAIFEHYFNLIICWEMLHFIDWHRNLRNDDEELSEYACNLIASSLNLSEIANDFTGLLHIIETAMYKFQADVNNVADGNMPKLSMAGVPIDIVAKQTQNLRQFKDKVYYLLIDEYENFTDDQQECINTLIKHVPDSYTIKIGVREMGWRVKTTHNNMESLNDPADYRLTKIEESFTDSQSADRFEEFARSVCNLRLVKLMDDDSPNYDIKRALVGISIEEEAEKLNVTSTTLYQSFLKAEKAKKMNLKIHPLYKFLIAYWAETHNNSLESTIDNYIYNQKTWNQRYDNYKYSLLFKLNKGKYIAISKYYAGWNTFVKLANGNIRYLMALVYQSYSLHIENDNDLKKPVSVEYQTIAAKNVGWKNLTELEGSCMIGIQLTQLIQTLGTIFRWLAKDGDKTAPEIVQFDFSGEISDRTREILKLGVMNLALVRMPSNKLSGVKSVKEFQYQLHPIFAPYFDYSFRKKRKLSISDKDFLDCIDCPNDAVAKILNKRKISMEDIQSVPNQLSLFDFDKLNEDYD